MQPEGAGLWNTGLRRDTWGTDKKDKWRESEGDTGPLDSNMWRDGLLKRQQTCSI